MRGSTSGNLRGALSGRFSVVFALPTLALTARVGESFTLPENGWAELPQPVETARTSNAAELRRRRLTIILTLKAITSVTPGITSVTGSGTNLFWPRSGVKEG